MLRDRYFPYKLQVCLLLTNFSREGELQTKKKKVQNLQKSENFTEKKNEKFTENVHILHKKFKSVKFTEEMQIIQKSLKGSGPLRPTCSEKI